MNTEHVQGQNARLGEFNNSSNQANLVSTVKVPISIMIMFCMQIASQKYKCTARCKMMLFCVKTLELHNLNYST